MQYTRVFHTVLNYLIVLCPFLKSFECNEDLFLKEHYYYVTYHILMTSSLWKTCQTSSKSFIGKTISLILRFMHVSCIFIKHMFEKCHKTPFHLLSMQTKTIQWVSALLIFTQTLKPLLTWKNKMNVTFKVDALWFGYNVVIIWFLGGKNKSKWFLLFSLSDIFSVYSWAHISACVLRKFIIAYKRSHH